MSHHHVLLLGGNGKVARYLTPLLLKRSWAVTSIIRDQGQVADLEKLGNGQLKVLVRSIEDVKSEAQAQALIDEVKPDYVVWSAGAGGKGGAERTFAIDRDAATHFIHAAAATPAVTRFLMVSYIGSRRARPHWWSAAEWDRARSVSETVLANYHRAKLAADEALYRAARARGEGFAGICLRPGTLTVQPAGGVELGRTKDARGEISREAVAQVADELLAVEGVKSVWLDLLDGKEGVKEAVERVISEGVDAVEGEAIVNEP